MNVRALARPATTLSVASWHPSNGGKPYVPCISFFTNGCNARRRSPPSRRQIHKYAAVKRTLSPKDRIAQDPTLDERIGALDVHLVDEDSNNLGPIKPLRQVLSGLDRENERLRKVGVTEDGIAVCKVVTMEKLLQEQRLKDVASKKQSVADTTKQVELTWAIAENDLSHRVKRLQGFLREGKRLEILIAPKKRGRRATSAEIQALLERIEGAVQEVEGASPWKATDGEAGKQMMLFFQGPRKSESSLLQEEVAKTEARMKRKEAEEKERKEKDEKRMTRKKEMEQKARLPASA